MKERPDLWSEGGIFTMIHTNIPHTPYRETDCSIANYYGDFSKEGYKSSVHCSFNRIHELSNYIIKNYPDAAIVIQSDHGVFPDIYDSSKKFVDHSKILIDHRLGAFNAMRGCNADQISKLNQTNIVENIVECMVNGKFNKYPENKSFWGLYEESQDFGKVFRIR